jgi:hypothetical protein
MSNTTCRSAEAVEMSDKVTIVEEVILSPDIDSTRVDGKEEWSYSKKRW